MILLVLIALVARIDAAPGGASVGLAIRYADALTGAERAAVLDEDGDEEAEDRAVERAEIRAEIDDDEDEEEAVEGGRSAKGELPALLGEIARTAASLLGDRGDAVDRADLGLDGDDASALQRLRLDDDATGVRASLGLEDATSAIAGLGLDGDATGARASLEFEDATSAMAGLGFDDATGARASLRLDADDASAAARLARGDDDGAAGWSAGAGALAMLDAELAPGDATAGLDAANAGATAGAQEVYEQSMRHQRPSWWGRLDVGVSWRHRWSEPIRTPAYSHDEIWLVATWRR